MNIRSSVLLTMILISLFGFRALANDLSVYFGGKSIDDLRFLNGGTSGSTIRAFSVGKEHYVERILGEHSQKLWIQQLAAMNDLSPKIVVTDIEHNLVIMEYIHSQLQSGYIPDEVLQSEVGLAAIASLLSRLHKIPVSQVASVSFFAEAMELRKLLPKLTSHIDEMIDHCFSHAPPGEKQVIVHNDLHGRNILFDGQRFYFIDWEHAGLGHPFQDLAYFVNFQLMTKAQGYSFLARYLERDPTEAELVLLDQFRKIRYGISAVRTLHAVAHHIGDVNLRQIVEKEMLLPKWPNIEDAFKAADNDQKLLTNLEYVVNFAVLLLREAQSF